MCVSVYEVVFAGTVAIGTGDSPVGVLPLYIE